MAAALTAVSGLGRPLPQASPRPATRPRTARGRCRPSCGSRASTCARGVRGRPCRPPGHHRYPVGSRSALHLEQAETLAKGLAAHAVLLEHHRLRHGPVAGSQLPDDDVVHDVACHRLRRLQGAGDGTTGARWRCSFARRSSRPGGGGRGHPGPGVLDRASSREASISRMLPPSLGAATAILVRIGVCVGCFTLTGSALFL